MLVEIDFSEDIDQEEIEKLFKKEGTTLSLFLNSVMKKLVEDFGEAATYDIDASAFDSATGKAIFCCTFGGFTHYVYTIEVKENTVVAMTKVWNDAYAATKM